MSLADLTASRKLYAKEWKIVWWTLGMSLGTFLITDGKTLSNQPIQHLVIGALLGWLVGIMGLSKAQIELIQCRHASRPIDLIFRYPIPNKKPQNPQAVIPSAARNLLLSLPVYRLPHQGSRLFATFC
jgi:hypothetical protein